MDTLPAKMHREWRTRRETVRAWRRVARDGTDGTAVDENEAKADKIDEIDAFRERARFVPRARRSYFGNVARATRVSRPRVSRARRRTTARLFSRTHSRRGATRCGTRGVDACAARAPKVSDEGSSPPSRFARGASPRNVAASPRVSRRRWTPRATPRWNRARSRNGARPSRANERGRLSRWRDFVAAPNASEPYARYARGRSSPTRDDRNDSEEERHERTGDRVVVSTATRSWAAWVAYASDVRAKGAALASRFSRSAASRRAFRAWRFESLGVARLARARDARVTRTVTNRWRATATVSARARSEAETRFATIRLATLREAAAMGGTRARARERVVERLADAHASRLCVFSRFSSWVDRVAAVRAEAAAVRFAIETTTRRSRRRVARENRV